MSFHPRHKRISDGLKDGGAEPRAVGCVVCRSCGVEVEVLCKVCRRPTPLERLREDRTTCSNKCGQRYTEATAALSDMYYSQRRYENLNIFRSPESRRLSWALDYLVDYIDDKDREEGEEDDA